MPPGDVVDVFGWFLFEFDEAELNVDQASTSSSASICMTASMPIRINRCQEILKDPLAPVSKKSEGLVY